MVIKWFYFSFMVISDAKWLLRELLVYVIDFHYYHPDILVGTLRSFEVVVDFSDVPVAREEEEELLRA